MPLITNAIMTSTLLNLTEPLTYERLLRVHLECPFRTQFKPASFAGMIISLRRSKRKLTGNGVGNNIKVTVFKSGALVLSGVHSPDRGMQLARVVLRQSFLQDDLECAAWKFQNIVGSFAVDLQCDQTTHVVENLKWRFGDAYTITYEPELSPAIILRRRRGMQNGQSGGNALADCAGGITKATIQLHHTGEAIISGCRSLEEFYELICCFTCEAAVCSQCPNNNNNN